MTLASAFELKGDYDAAISEYDSLLKDQPGSMVVANNLASLLTDHRTDEASLDRAYSLVASLQKSPIPHFKDTVGWVQYRRGNFKDSTSLLEQAATELPSIATVRYHLGMSYIAIGQNTKAVEQLEKARTLASNDNSLQEEIRAGLKQAGVN
jgi:tetratricopeptide (TPR) repeat protein